MRYLYTLLSLFLLTSCTAENHNNSAPISEDVQTSSSLNEEQMDTDTTEDIDNINIEERRPQWNYSISKDEMRDETLYTAFLESENTIYLPFPYNGGTKLTLILRDSPKNGNDIFFSIPNGQLHCGHRGCTVPIKFDDAPIEEIPMVNAEFSTKQGDAIFVADSKTRNLLSMKLKNSESMMIEIPFFQNGYHQFKFNTKGLKWEHF
ncbi:hypothetical protein L1281_001654 [Neisseria sp. HSC-16F19]|nr:hypothetical protein [Neisseria sp. HSC-16F19]MCP2041060.1 hypothetical protein [Neisseria sp. HSC-16F19]